MPAKNLLLTSSDQDEEKRLAGFASQNRLLHPDYTDSALNFFHACRDRRETILVEEMVQWAKAANTDPKKQAVRKYLGLGDQRQELSEALTGRVAATWIEKDAAIQSILESNSRINDAIGGVIPPAPPVFPPPLTPQGDLDRMLVSICCWWQEKHHTETQRYNERLYPISVDELKKRLHNSDYSTHRSAWMILLFLGTFHTIGRTSHEQHRDFIKFCMNRSPNWWEIFTQPKPQDYPNKWMSILEDYMNDQIGDMPWYIWVEKFPTFYRIARYLDDYIQSILSIESTSSVFIKHLTAPRTNPFFSRGGPDAPPIRLGIGINFVLRELIRFGVLSPQEHIIQHCFVPRANVRRLLTSLGCDGLSNSDPHNSRVIYQFLKRRFPALNLPIPPTFENTFDIPFELVAENPSRFNLRQFEKLDLDEIDVEEDSLYEGEDNKYEE